MDLFDDPRGIYKKPKSIKLRVWAATGKAGWLLTLVLLGAVWYLHSHQTKLYHLVKEHEQDKQHLNIQISQLGSNLHAKSRDLHELTQQHTEAAGAVSQHKSTAERCAADLADLQSQFASLRQELENSLRGFEDERRQLNSLLSQGTAKIHELEARLGNSPAEAHQPPHESQGDAKVNSQQQEGHEHQKQQQEGTPQHAEPQDHAASVHADGTHEVPHQAAARVDSNHPTTPDVGHVDHNDLDIQGTHGEAVHAAGEAVHPPLHHPARRRGSISMLQEHLGRVHRRDEDGTPEATIHQMGQQA